MLNRNTMLHLRILFWLVLALAFFSFREGDDPLDKREFTISLSETKNGVVAKRVIMDKIEFRKGKLRTSLLREKFGYNWIPYHINRDTSFVDSTETSVRLLEVEAVLTNEQDQTVYVNFVTCEWDLDGTIKITKHDKLKKYYDMSGREKGGKPQKERRHLFEILE